jgi:glucan phosphoethanolaminetransferase (alkaline phosphatase superfamily)
MVSYGAGVRRRIRESLVIFAQAVPIFATIAYFSNFQKALVATTIIGSIWVAVSARKDGWQMPSFWWIVALVSLLNAVVVWALPLNERFNAGLAVTYPLGMAEGFGVYWLLGWWLRRAGGGK